MEALLLIGGSFLIWAIYCWIAWVLGYSPEKSAKRRLEQCEEMLSERMDRLRRIQATAETPPDKRKVDDLEEEIEALRQCKDLLERGF